MFPSSLSFPWEFLYSYLPRKHPPSPWKLMSPWWLPKLCGSYRVGFSRWHFLLEIAHVFWEFRLWGCTIPGPVKTLWRKLIFHLFGKQSGHLHIGCQFCLPPGKEVPVSALYVHSLGYTACWLPALKLWCRNWVCGLMAPSSQSFARFIWMWFLCKLAGSFVATSLGVLLNSKHPFLGSPGQKTQLSLRFNFLC